MKKEKPYNNGQWTQARFNSFIKSALRSASNRWGPKVLVLKRAWVERGKYYCAGYDRNRHIVNVSILKGKKRKRNVSVDHIIPIMWDNSDNNIDWNKVIKNMFCEVDGLQVLCKDCHDKKTKEERQIRNEQRRSSK